MVRSLMLKITVLISRNYFTLVLNSLLYAYIFRQV